MMNSQQHEIWKLTFLAAFHKVNSTEQAVKEANKALEHYLKKDESVSKGVANG